MYWFMYILMFMCMNTVHGVFVYVKLVTETYNTVHLHNVYQKGMISICNIEDILISSNCTDYTEPAAFGNISADITWEFPLHGSTLSTVIAPKEKINKVKPIYIHSHYFEEITVVYRLPVVTCSLGMYNGNESLVLCSCSAIDNTKHLRMLDDFNVIDITLVDKEGHIGLVPISNSMRIRHFDNSGQSVISFLMVFQKEDFRSGNIEYSLVFTASPKKAYQPIIEQNTVVDNGYGSFIEWETFVTDVSMLTISARDVHDNTTLTEQKCDDQDAIGYSSCALPVDSKSVSVSNIAARFVPQKEDIDLLLYIVTYIYVPVFFTIDLLLAICKVNTL